MLPARSQPWGTRACQSWAAVEMAASSNHGICEILLRSILWRQKTMLHQDLLWDVWVNASSSFFSFFFEFSILESANNCLDARFMMQGWERLPRPVFSRNSLPALDLLNLPTFFSFSMGPLPRFHLACEVTRCAYSSNGMYFAAGTSEAVWMLFLQLSTVTHVLCNSSNSIG